jgi:hypothetical protein
MEGNVGEYIEGPTSIVDVSDLDYTPSMRVVGFTHLNPMADEVMANNPLSMADKNARSPVTGVTMNPNPDAQGGPEFIPIIEHCQPSPLSDSPPVAQGTSALR